MIVAILAITSAATQGQTIRQELSADCQRSAGNFLAYPDSGLPAQTPPPKGKKPFYINHYGANGSYYIDLPTSYETPCKILAHADSLGKLTPLGRDVLTRLELLRRDAQDRTGELSEVGVRQQRALIRRMLQNYPDMFTKDTDISGRSSTVNRCILSMEQAMVQLALLKPMTMRHKSTKQHRYYINPQEPELTAQRMDSLTTACYEAFAAKYNTHERLMRSLFNDTAYVSTHVDANTLTEQLFNLANSIQNTELAGKVTLYDLFTEEEIYLNWKKQNAWWYINYGGYTLNGGKQPYLQRMPLRKMIDMGDSIQTLTRPVVHLRYTLETVILSLACLLELDGYGLATDDLESLETQGWADYRICPMGCNIQMILYRSKPGDTDVLAKVLLNEREVTLPLETDCAPYYHWKDVRQYYLTKLEEYEKITNNK